MKTNEQKAKESRIKLGNKYLQIFLERVRIWGSSDKKEAYGTMKGDKSFTYKTEDGLFFLQFSEFGSLLTRLNLKIGKGMFEFCFANIYKDEIHDDYDDFPGIKEFIEQLRSCGKVLNQEKFEKESLDRYVHQEQEFIELDAKFPTK